jgi:CO/xanthine dehydrogenase Mo-binding subunit
LLACGNECCHRPAERITAAFTTGYDVIFVQTDEPTGSLGAKPVAEIAIDGMAPALAGAVHDVTGVWIRTLPYTPERVWHALHPPEVGEVGPTRAVQ